MLALRIDYLTGRCVATSYNDRSSVEWPPHPARVFFALVSAWGEAGTPDDDERRALEWLAAQAAPALAVDRSITSRSVVTHYVPVNDTAVLSTKFGSIGDRLTKARADEETLSGELAGVTGDKDQRRVQAKLEKTRQQVAKLDAELETRQRADQDEVSGASKDMETRAVALLPERRGRQPRTFPSRALEDATLHLLWDAVAPDDVRLAIDAVARRVTHIGHSSSLVACRVAEEAPAPTLVPHDEGDLMLRVPAEGLVERLVDAHARHLQVEPRVTPCAFQAYGPVEASLLEAPVPSLFGDDWLVFRQVGGPRLSSTLAVDVASAMRGALMSHADDPVPEVLSGHAPDGTPSTGPHAAFVPLPHVGHRHATGTMLGVAVVLPRVLDDESRRAVLRAVGRWEAAARREVDDQEVDAPPLSLRLGSRGVLELERVAWGLAPQAALKPVTWTRVSRQWMSVTPVALDRNPGNLYAADPAVSAAAWLQAGDIVATSCERIGLPRPVRVEILPSVTLPGVLKARAYPAFPADRRKPQRVKVHAFVEFAESVRGPVLLGGGRFFGLGLFRPVEESDAQGADR